MARSGSVVTAALLAGLAVCSSAARVHLDFNETEEHSADKYTHGHHECLPKLLRASEEEMKVMKRIITPVEPHSLGSGADVQFGRGERRHYNSLRLISAWKVDPESWKIKEYEAKVDEFNNHPSRQGKIPALNTLLDDVVEADRARGALKDNEYYLLHGGDTKWMHNEMCHGSTYGGKGLFGWGIYLADVADKMDQYVSYDARAATLTQLLKGHKDEQAMDTVKREGGVYMAYVMRTYMGRFVQVQQEKGHHHWCWRDPVSGQVRVTSGSNGYHPFEGTTFDSTKVMSSHYEHHNHQHGDFRDYFKDVGGCRANFPNRFNEYLVPDEKKAAIAYVLVYEREQLNEHGERVHVEREHIESEHGEVEDAEGEHAEGEHAEDEHVEGEHVEGEHVEGKDFKLE